MIYRNEKIQKEKEDCEKNLQDYRKVETLIKSNKNKNIQYCGLVHLTMENMMKKQK